MWSWTAHRGQIYFSTVKYQHFPIRKPTWNTRTPAWITCRIILLSDQFSQFNYNLHEISGDSRTQILMKHHEILIIYIIPQMMPELPSPFKSDSTETGPSLQLIHAVQMSLLFETTSSGNSPQVPPPRSKVTPLTLILCSCFDPPTLWNSVHSPHLIPSQLYTPLYGHLSGSCAPRK